jgi:ribosomal protein S12 methylthiotransferase accessory factor
MRSAGVSEMVLIGDGLLAETIARVQGGKSVVRGVDPADASDIPRDTSIAVVASDAWDTRAYPAVRKVCADRKVPWLPVRAELGRVVIGPVELLGAAGCVACAETRRRLARQDGRGFDEVWQQHETTLVARPSSWLTGQAAELVAELVAEEIRCVTTGSGSARTRCAMLYVDLRTLRTTVHRFLADPLCAECGEMPDDSAALAEIALRSRPKAAPVNYRVRAIAAEMDTLKQTYVDAETGLVRGLYRGSEGWLTIAAAPMGLRNGGVESGYGRTRSYRTSELTALLEALERYGGMQPGGKRTVVHAGYREVADRAIDPRKLGTHPEESYRIPGFSFRRFDESQPCRWVWGYSFSRHEPILIPESYAYYRVPRAEGEPPPFVYEISNGCALGGCLEEAILYGILEVAERDAFLMTWYARIPAPRIDPSSARDRTIPMLINAIWADAGYEVMMFDVTVEQRIPCVWAMAVHPADNGPKMVCAAGSNPDPERAAENALSELGPILTELVQRYPEQQERAEKMARDPFLVTAMSDHSLAYGNPDVFHRLRFLTDSPSHRGFPDIVQPTAFRHDDLRDDLREMIGRYLESGLDVIVVDQTTPEHRATDLTCVKVVIPGTLPMTFGHAFRRTEGLPRLNHVPRLLGHRDRPLRPEDVNPYPHPFP